MTKKMIFSAIAGAVVGAALVAVGAPAQVMRGHNANAPVSFDAGQIELQDRASRVVLSGGVSVTQAGLNLRAPRVTVAYSDASGIDVNRIDATGGVTIVKGNERATGNAAIYDLDRRLITLVGNVRLSQGANRLSGGRVVIDLNSGRSIVDGRAVGGSGESGGRVSGSFTVPQRGD